MTPTRDRKGRASGSSRRMAGRRMKRRLEHIRQTTAIRESEAELREAGRRG